MAREYEGRVAFYVIYIREAHPTDGWQVAVNEREGVVFEQPNTFVEREAVAEACVLHLDLSIPTVLDEMGDEVGRGYAAWPDRLYLVDPGGRIAYRGGPGPGGFKPDELEDAIKTLLANSAALSPG